MRQFYSIFFRFLVISYLMVVPLFQCELKAQANDEVLLDLPFMVVPKIGVNGTWVTYNLGQVFIPGFGVVSFQEDDIIQFSYQYGASVFIPLSKKINLITGFENQWRVEEASVERPGQNASFSWHRYRFRNIIIPVSIGRSIYMSNNGGAPYGFGIMGGLVYSTLIGQRNSRDTSPLGSNRPSWVDIPDLSDDQISTSTMGFHMAIYAHSQYVFFELGGHFYLNDHLDLGGNSSTVYLNMGIPIILNNKKNSRNRTF
ncbi:MAG: hypothetical protein LAT68_17665 [Cyclobacteriaceae bacterium]|nr:hypothetical protein [Cyclobacteriaceae bacterium]MCH8518127.1 hypothetical protein [Cyclobacteriaceae bacterium]